MKHNILYLIAIIILLFLNTGTAQNDTIQKQPFLFLAEVSPYDNPPYFTVDERRISIIAEAQIWRNFYLNVGVSLDKTTFHRRGVSAGNSLGLSMEYNPFAQTFAPRISFSQYTIAFAYRVNALYYIANDDKAPALRPELGMKFNRYEFYLGRNFFFEKGVSAKFNRWVFSFSYHPKILPRRKNKR